MDSPDFKGLTHQYGQSFGDENWAGAGYLGDAARAELRERASRICGEFMQMRWYPQVNDLIGGWCVMPVDEPPSKGLPEVADFLSREAAEHIALLHNQWLEARPGA